MIKDKVVIVTGASSGIGEATARLLATKGAKLVLGARREDKLRQIAGEIVKDGGQAVYQELDVTDPSANAAIVDLAKKEFGSIDVIFLNAGIMPNSPLSALKTNDWHQMVDINVKGVLNGVAAVLPTFTEQKSGHIIATSSVAGLKAYPGGAVYGGTKWFLRDFMEVLRMEAAQEGTNIRTATIYPAAINTELLKTISHEGTAKGMQQTYDRFGISPDRIASVVAFAIDLPEDTTVNGAGNPPNPDGMKTDYLWREVLTREGLTDILENYAQLVEAKDDKTGKKKQSLIFPRYHQRDVVRKLLADARAKGPGTRYLIQHSAGSGKSNSIAWLAHQLVGLEEGSIPIYDSVIVVTDRVLLDKQIRDTIKQFAQVGSIVGHAERSGQLREFLKSGKKIIITTVQKFPYVLADIGDEHRNSKFAILIDEAHSSQGGRTSAKMNIALSEAGADEEDEDIEDEINRLMEARKMLPNASYFAFTATPKNKTLEVFGEPDPQSDGTVKHRPFHSYTMKQAIQEGFILDVLANYTPYQSYYNLVKTIEDDPEFDNKKAQRKLKAYVEGHPHAIRRKAEIMVDHFHDQVMAKQKVGGQARAMVVTGSIMRAIQYFHAFEAYLAERKSPFRAIVAFSGEHAYSGAKVTEATMNGFSSSKIADNIQDDPYRFLICADKFQTGYDEPLLHSMYVDKPLSGIKAVQTLSRLNRAHPRKHDTFILDFVNDADGIQLSFEPFYRTTILSGETDPNKLHDLKADLDGYQVYDDASIDVLVELYLGGAERDKLEPILESSVATYVTTLDEDQQVDFKGKGKAFVRAYGFLASILPYSNASWEKLSVFLNFLVPKLPEPKGPDLAKGILESLDMDSYRVEARSTIAIALADEDKEIEPVPATGGGKLPEPELDHLSNIIRTFNEQFGNIEWNDVDKIREVITTEIPAKVAADTAYQNAMKNSDKQNARIEHDKALQRVIIDLLSDHTELFKQFSDNPSFRKWLGDSNFTATYHEGPQPQ